MFHTLFCTGLSPVYVSFHIHDHVMFFPRPSLSRTDSHFTIFPALLPLPKCCPAPLGSRPSPHPTHHASTSTLLFSAFSFHPSLTLSFALSLFPFPSLRVFSTSSESHTSWIIYSCMSVGDLNPFLDRLLLKDRKAVFCQRKKTNGSFNKGDH